MLDLLLRDLKIFLFSLWCLFISWYLFSRLSFDSFCETIRLGYLGTSTCKLFPLTYSKYVSYLVLFIMPLRLLEFEEIGVLLSKALKLLSDERLCFLPESSYYRAINLHAIDASLFTVRLADYL